MKPSAIKKGLGGRGKLIWLEPECLEGFFGIICHPSNEMLYGDEYLYLFEEFINCADCDSAVLNAIKERFGVERVFAYQDYITNPDFVDPKFKVIGENGGYSFYDCDCSYLILLKNDIETEELCIFE